MLHTLSNMMMGSKQIKNLEPVQSLPAMTSNTLPSGHIVSASSFYDFNASAYAPFHAFDQIVLASSGAWVSGEYQVTNQWLQRQLPVPIEVGKYVLKCDASWTAPRFPSSFKLQGSNDGASFVDLDVRTGEVWPGTGVLVKEFIPALSDMYSYYRLLIVANSGDGQFLILDELELWQLL